MSSPRSGEVARNAGGLDVVLRMKWGGGAKRRRGLTAGFTLLQDTDEEMDGVMGRMFAELLGR